MNPLFSCLLILSSLSTCDSECNKVRDTTAVPAQAASMGFMKMMGLRNSHKTSRHQASGTSTDGDKKMKVGFWSKACVLKIAPTIFFLTWVLRCHWVSEPWYPFFMFQMLFPYEEFVKFFQCDFFDLSPRGLLNCGNRYQLPAFVFFWQYLVAFSSYKQKTIY